MDVNDKFHEFLFKITFHLFNQESDIKFCNIKMNKGDKRCFYALQPGQKRFVRIYFADTKPPSDNDLI